MLSGAYKGCVAGMASAYVRRGGAAAAVAVAVGGVMAQWPGSVGSDER